MRVLHVDPERAWGGGEVQVLALARVLRDRGHEVRLAAHPDGVLWSAARAAGLETVPLSIRNHVDVLAGARLRRLARQSDVVHFHTARAHALAPCLAGLAARRVVTRRMDYVPRGGPYARWLYNHTVDSVIAISRGVETALVRGGVRPERIRVVPSAVDLERIAVGAGARAERRRAWGVADEDVLVVAVGALERRKGHDVLIEAVARLAAEPASPPLRCVLVGAGREGEALGALARRRGVSVALAGFLADVGPALAAADVVVLASRAEGLGVAALEAMAAGRSVIGTRVGGLAEVIEDGHTGLLVPPEDPDALAHALATLRADPAARARLGAAGRAYVTARHGVAAMADGTIACYGKAP
jgi:glycosyltransferase involved in cell wall biosynthesis